MNSKDNWFSNLFRSKEANKQLQKNLQIAKEDLDYAQISYEGYSKNVISYETILQRNGGKKFDFFSNSMDIISGKISIFHK